MWKSYNGNMAEERIPCELGKYEKLDSVYVWNEVADVFIISEPLAGRQTGLNGITLQNIDAGSLKPQMRE